MRNRTAGNTMLMHTASNLYDIKMATPGWPSSCNTGIKVTLAELASLGHVTRPFLWVVLSHSLLLKAWEFAVFVVHLIIIVTHAVCTWRCWSLPLSQFEQKNATCLQVHFDQPILRNHLFSEHMWWNYASCNVKSNRLTSIFSNKIIKLPKFFICGHSSHVIPITETIPYLSHAWSRNFMSMRDMFGSRQLRAKIL